MRHRNTSIIHPVPIAGVLSLCTFLALTQPGVARAQEFVGRSHDCSISGSWMGSTSTGCTFFATYAAGATANAGPMSVEWISGDPTLFNNFPTVVTRTQGSGTWRSRGQRYEFTWTCYGLDGAGNPVYAMTVSGTGWFDGCHASVFEWVGEVFPWPMNPLVDPPPVCISGTGAVDRISVDLATCPDHEAVVLPAERRLVTFGRRRSL